MGVHTPSALIPERLLLSFSLLLFFSFYFFFLSFSFFFPFSFATLLRGLSEHFASLVFSKKRLLHSSFSLSPRCLFLFSFSFLFLFLIHFQKKVPAINGDFDFFFQKSACY